MNCSFCFFLNAGPERNFDEPSAFWNGKGSCLWHGLSFRDEFYSSGMLLNCFDCYAIAS